MAKITIYSIFLIFILCFCVHAQKYKLCTVPRYLGECQQLNRTEDIECIVQKNTVNCILLIENGQATLAAISAEEAVLASSLTGKVVVLGEFRDATTKDDAEYTAVVVVKKDINNFSFKGAKLCHPGVDTTLITPAVLNELEMKVLSENNIDLCTNSNNTLIENYIGGLSNFLGPSCRPGPWIVANKTFDEELKQKYPSLIELCQKEAYLENINTPLIQSLNCVLNGDGDIGITSLLDLKSDTTRFKKALQNLLLLCKNGTVVNITEECTWTKQPRRLLIANADFTSQLSNDLRTWFGTSIYDNDIQLVKTDVLSEDGNSRAVSEKLIPPLREILFPDANSQIKIINSPSLKNYLKDFGRDVPTFETSQLCKQSAKLCISQTEEVKCKWLQQAALNYGMQPPIDCIALKDKTLCVNSIQSEAADFAVISDNMMYYANRKQNFSLLGFGEQPLKELKRTILVVKTEIKSLHELKNKRGCFSEYGDRAFLAFITLMEEYIWPNSLYYIESISDFFDKSCMPGVKDQHGHEPRPFSLDVDKLCDICEAIPDSDTSSTCNPLPDNNFYGDSGALRCLTNRGDFAVLTLQDNMTLPTNTSIMCKNGTLTQTLPIDDECALSLTTAEIIVARKHDPNTKNILLLIEEMDYRFAINPEASFKVFDEFGTEKDLIFKDKTMGIEIATTTTNKYLSAQREMFDSIPQLISANSTSTDNSASAAYSLRLSISSSLVATSLILIYVVF